ncbi:MAG: flavodoxin family protein [Bacillota bacterium]
MKLLAITAGRKMGNTEIVVKEALMAAQELGAEIQMINLHDFRILPCTGCESCTMKVTRGGKPECIHKDKDDMDRIMQAVLKCNGLIIGVPVYELQPPGIYNVFANRFLPYEVAFLLEAKIIDKAPERVAGLIAVGGSTPTWMTMALPSLYISMFTQTIKVVDQMLVTGVPRPGQVLLKEEFLARARRMGENLVRAMQTPWAEVQWLGDEDGWCPVCHSNLLLLGKPRWDGEQYTVECAVCGAGGNIETREGKPVFVVDKRSLRTYRLESETRKDHFYEIKTNHDYFFANADKVKEKLGRYREFKVPGLD